MDVTAKEPQVKTKVSHIFSLLERIRKSSLSSLDQAHLIREKLLATAKSQEKGQDVPPSNGILERVITELSIILEDQGETINYHVEVIKELEE